MTDKIKLDLYVVGNNLRTLRMNKRLTQLEVVEALDISYNHYAKIEEGMRGMSMKMLFKLINFYQVDANYILGVTVEKEAC